MFLLTFILFWMLPGTEQQDICQRLHANCNSAVKVENVALRGRSTQSTITLKDAYGSSDNVIDGNQDPMYFHGSCFSTERQKSPWFRVDLLQTYIISQVVITNRGDCCADFINGAEILIGDSLSNNGNNNQRCAKITTIPLGGTQTFSCPNMKGRYVNVILHDVTQYLTFCEIQIFGVPAKQQCCQPVTAENVALRGRSAQSTITLQDAYGSSDNVIDGNQDPMYFHGSCFSTERQKSPWFRVDLLETYVISQVVITNRGDCCADFINGAEILIGDSLNNNGNNNQKCASITTIALGGTETFNCPNMKGRYVNVILRDITRHLTFCEIQIFGVPDKQQCCHNLD